MKRETNLLTSFALIISTFLWTVIPTSAQSPKNTSNTKSRMIYHGGPVMAGPADVFLIFYGCWTSNCGDNGSPTTVGLLQDFASNVGATPYFAINTGYPDVNGYHPSG